MSNELELAYEMELETHNKVIELIARGKRPGDIEELTGVPPRVQREIYAKFENYAQNDFQTQARARAIVAELDVSYSFLISEMEKIADEAEIQQDWKLKKEALKEMASIIKMRQDSLTKAGILSSEGLGDEIVRAKEATNKVIAVLKKVANKYKDKYPEVIREIAQGIADIEGEVIDVR